MKRVNRIAFNKWITTYIKARGKLPNSLWLLVILFWLAITPQPTWANDTTVRFTATIGRVVGLDGAMLSAGNKEVRGEIRFTDSNHLEPGFYDGHTWQNAVKQITFEAPINARFTGMGVALYPDHNFISVFYSPNKCPQIGILCSASGASKFTLPDGTEVDLKALSYHIHQSDSEEPPPPELAAVIERFIANAGNGTTQVLVRYHGKGSREPVLSLLMTMDAIERVK